MNVNWTPEAEEDRAKIVAYIRADKIGAKIIRHGRSIAFLMAEVMVERALFRQILAAIAAPHPSPLSVRC